MSSSLLTEHRNTWKITLWFIFRTTCSHCSTATCLCRSNLPVDTAQCQLHQWGWTHCGSWGRILHSQWELEWSAASGLHKLQNWPPWPRHRVWNQCASHQTRGGWHWISWASPENKNQVCRWVPGVNLLMAMVSLGVGLHFGLHSWMTVFLQLCLHLMQE